jgi:hypothetical protein
MPAPAPSPDCDVLVCGAGVAGVAAAVSAARRGSRVVLIEQDRQLGGIGTHGLLRTICGLYLNGDDAPTKTLNKGIVREVVSGLLAAAPNRSVWKTGHVFVMPYADGDLLTILGSLCKQESSLEILLGTRVVSALARNGRIDEVVTEGSQAVRFRPGAVIDATGSGEIGFFAGAGFDLAEDEQRQMAGYIVRIQGLTLLDGLELKVPYVLAGVTDSRASSSLRFTTFTPGDEPGEGYLKFNSTGPEGSERDQQMETDVAVALEGLVARLPAFRHAVIASRSDAVMDREGRRLRGEYVLTEEDVVLARKFPDAAARNAWPIELWNRQQGTVYRYLPKGEYYEIPFRSLVVKGFGNLLAAGRCISASHAAQGSIRVMGCCMATGDAAGRAAAALVKNGEYGDYRVNE